MKKTSVVTVLIFVLFFIACGKSEMRKEYNDMMRQMTLYTQSELVKAQKTDDPAVIERIGINYFGMAGAYVKPFKAKYPDAAKNGGMIALSIDEKQAADAYKKSVNELRTFINTWAVERGVKNSSAAAKAANSLHMISQGSGYLLK